MTCTELYYSFIKMCLHFKKRLVFTKRREKYERMVVNFYEEKEKKVKFIWCQNQLSGEIHLEIFKRRNNTRIAFYTPSTFVGI